MRLLSFLGSGIFYLSFNPLVGLVFTHWLTVAVDQDFMSTPSVIKPVIEIVKDRPRDGLKRRFLIRFLAYNVSSLINPCLYGLQGLGLMLTL
jgi:hypothetical protein